MLFRHAETREQAQRGSCTHLYGQAIALCKEEAAQAVHVLTQVCCISRDEPGGSVHSSMHAAAGVSAAGIADVRRAHLNSAGAGLGGRHHS